MIPTLCLLAPRARGPLEPGVIGQITLVLLEDDRPEGFPRWRCLSDDRPLRLRVSSLDRYFRTEANEIFAASTLGSDRDLICRTIKVIQRKAMFTRRLGILNRPQGINKALEFRWLDLQVVVARDTTPVGSNFHILACPWCSATFPSLSPMVTP